LQLLKQIFDELREPLAAVGLTSDSEGDDFAFISELIDPPKRKLTQLLDCGKLFNSWSEVLRGRPVEKAWLHEIVSNWRSGTDVDKFDYFRRDAMHLGVHREFDHNRYLKGIKILIDPHGIPTISPPEKEREGLRDNMYELRKMLHRSAYQHKTVKKLELHMMDILKMMDDHVRVTGVGGRRLKMSEAALELDAVAYPKLTDTFVESLLWSGEDPHLEQATKEYERRIIRRELMRLVGNWDLPRHGEPGGPLPLPDQAAVIQGVYESYLRVAPTLHSDAPVRAVKVNELRCEVVKLHYGMGELDPISSILFHRKDDGRPCYGVTMDAKPLREKIFVFWNPDVDLSDTITVQRLSHAFTMWASNQVDRQSCPPPATPNAGGGHVSVTPSTIAAAARPSHSPHREQQPKPRRGLRIQASCPFDP